MRIYKTVLTDKQGVYQFMLPVSATILDIQKRGSEVLLWYSFNPVYIKLITYNVMVIYTGDDFQPDDFNYVKTIRVGVNDVHYYIRRR
jgi:hypothetical protein